MSLINYLSNMQPVEIGFAIFNLLVMAAGVVGVLLVRSAYRTLLKDLELLRQSSPWSRPSVHPVLESAIRDYDATLIASAGRVSVAAIVNRSLQRTATGWRSLSLGAAATWVRWVRTLISVCLVLGLFGTFVGLVISLTGVGGALEKAAAGSDVQSISDLLDQLRIMIGGMSTAFAASISGVFGSLVVTAFSAGFGTFVLADRVADELEDYLSNRHRPTEVVWTEREVQLKILETLGGMREDLAASFSSGLADAARQFAVTAESMSTVLRQIQPVTQSLSTSGNSLSELSSTMAKVTQQMHETIAALEIGQKELPARMAQLQQVEETLVATVSTLPDQNQKMLEGLDLFLQSARTLDKSMEHFRDQWPQWIEAFVSRTENAIENQTLSFADVVERLRAIMEQSRADALEHMGDLVATNQQTAEAVARRLGHSDRMSD